MTTQGIDAVLVETHNFGKTVAFWKSLGYELELETDHQSGRLVHPAGGPYIFVAERPPQQALQVVLGVSVPSAQGFRPPTSGTVTQPFEPQHWGALQMLVADPDGRAVAIEDTAARVALWRALHLEADPPPHVLVDDVGLRLVAPAAGWQQRPDMSPFTRPFRASILARARFVEDHVEARVARGVDQYVILGAGLDTLAQRRPELGARLTVFEVDQPGPQRWKQQRLQELGLGVPSFLRFVPVDFEAGDAWWEKLVGAGFDVSRPAVVASTGVSMYLTKDATTATLRQVATLAPGSTVVMSFMLPIEMAEPALRVGIERAAAGARANGTPFISFFTPAQMLQLARECGLREVEHVSAAALAERYFSGRTDGLRPPLSSEELLVASS
jgi:methyltransferase (TIGR00027 family)